MEDQPKVNSNLKHGTCTSSPLEGTAGSVRESIDMNTLDRLHYKQTGTKISDDPVVARIQREQALVRHKRSTR